jgi:predicted lipoprotein with Yx(FWY)xxD motif
MALNPKQPVTRRRFVGLVDVRVKLLPIAVFLAATIAACGSSTSSAEDNTVASASKPVPSSTSAKGPRLKIVSSDYGQILANGRGRALYLFTADTGKASTCSGDCATAWPPYIVRSKPVAGPGAKSRKIGTTRRSDGKLQATYAGHPVYFYVGDNESGEVLCQAVNEFGGYWYVLRASGNAVH